MTNYQATSYFVEDVNDDSAAFTELPSGSHPETDHVMKMWRTAFLDDGRPVEVNVLFTLDDVRGLQAYLNDRFGRSKLKAGTEYPFMDGAVMVLGPEVFISPDGQVLSYQGRNYVPQASEEDNASADLAFYPVPEQSLPAAGDVLNIQVGEDNYTETVSEVTPRPDGSVAVQFQPRQEQIRQCPVIYNGVQCAKAEGHHNSQGQPDGHEFVQDWLTVQPTQTGDGAATPPAAPIATPNPLGGEQAAESAPVAATTEAPSPSTEPAKRKVNRRKKEEKAYDDALEVFRANPNSQLEYTALTQAAEALRKRFPDADRLEKYDLHVLQQNVSYLLNTPQSQNLADHRSPEEQAAWEASQKPSDVPHFAPEPTPAVQPAPFVPPAAEEFAAAQAFPCAATSSDGRPCTRPFGHDVQTDLNPDPKPHIFATDLDRLGEQAQTLQQGPDHNAQGMNIQPFQAPGFISTPIQGNGEGFSQATIPPFQIPQPARDPGGYIPGTAQIPAEEAGSVVSAGGAPVLSFQIPPTPDGAELQPPAPAAPPWGQQ